MLKRFTILNPLPIFEGLAVTLRTFFERRVTDQWPEKPARLKDRFRGLHRLERYESGPYQGLEKCIGCSLCAAACPADVITVVAADNPKDKPFSPGERYAKVYDMQMLQCIFCGMCTEACPTEAIVMKHDFALADFSRKPPRDKFLYHKEDLLDREYYW